MMKKSQFNYLYDLKDKIIIYNTFSKSILEMTNEEYSKFQNDDYGSAKDLLVDNGFLVEDNFNEINYLKYIHYRTRFCADVLTLTVAPTLECNFDCPYCFEDKRKGHMSDEVKECIVEFINEKIKKGIKKISITWYGGEPLLQIKTIKDILNGIMDQINKYHVEIDQFLITNGYLLNEAVLEILKSCGIDHLQITIDGVKENHDKRRFLRTGKGTYDVIMNNLAKMKNYEFQIDVRMNLDNENYEDYKDLRELISRIGNSNIRIYPAVTEKINERMEERENIYMEGQKFKEFLANGHTDGYVDDYICEVEDNRCYFCSAELENTYVIDELGNVYKCWDEIGRENSICFNILHPDEIRYEALLKYMGSDPFDEVECRECELLPICFGGCRFQKGIGTHPVCAHTKESIDKFLDREIAGEEVLRDEAG